MTTRNRTATALAAMMVLPAPFALAQLEEVIVTAQKREEGLQDVPIAVQAFNTEALDNLTAQDIGELDLFTPNVEIPRSVNQPRYKIRGIGTDDFGIGADPAVGVYIDGVYVARGGGSKVAFNDIERIEILNGPQGTLFGRNAAAGAIQYITNKPDQEQGGWVRGTFGNYERMQLDGVYNLPINDELSWRVGALYNERDGYVKNNGPAGGLQFQKNWAFTTALRWEPTDRLDLIWRFEYDEIDQDSKAVTSAIYGPNRFDATGFDETTTNRRLDETRELYGTSLHLTYDMDWATFTSITAYRTYETENPENQDGWIDPFFEFNDYNAEDNKQFSQEFRFSGEAGRLLWTAGFNYHEENAKQRTGLELNPNAFDKLVVEAEAGFPYEAVPPGTGFDLAFAVFDLPRIYESGIEALESGDFYQENINVEGDYESWAIFADFTFDITETLALTLGGRYTEDKKDFKQFVPINDHGVHFQWAPTFVDENGDYDPDGSMLGIVEQDGKWDEFTPRVVLDWRVADDVLLYASWAEGYKAGGFNSANVAQPPFDPASVENLEFGIKSQWLDNTLRVNAAYFMYDYTNLQELNQIPAACIPGSSFALFQFENSDAEGEGLELQIDWAPIAGLQLWGSLGTLEAEYSDRVRQRAVDGVCDPIDETGEKFQGPPELAYALGATYTHDFSGGGALTGSISYGWQEGETGRRNCSFVQEPGGDTGAYYEFDTDPDSGSLIISKDSAVGTLTEPPFESCPDLDDRENLNARLAYFSASGAWEVAAWVTNWTNWSDDSGEAGGNGTEISSAFTDGAPSYDRREPPRMYGVELKYSF